MLPALSILLLAIAVGVYYWWQKALSKQSKRLLKEAAAAGKSGQLAAMEQLCLRAVECSSHIWLGRADALIVAQYNLAAAYFLQKKLEQAEQVAAKAFEEQRRFGRASAIVIPLIGLMARIHMKLGKDLSAGAFFEVSVQLLRRIHGERSLKVGLALHELGLTLNRAGVPERAIGVLEECIPILEGHRGKNHHDVVSALTNLGLAQSGAKHYADAEQTQRRIVAMRETTLGLDDPEVAQALNNLSVTYKRQERIPEALECLRRSLAIRESKLGPDHPNVGLVLINLGNCLRLEKKYDEADGVLIRAKSILANPPHKSFVTVLDSLASLRADQRRYEEAEQFYVACLKIHENRPISNLLELAEICDRYAGVLYKLQKEKQADAMTEKVSKLRSAREKLLTQPT